MLAFAILSFGILVIFLYVVVYIGECIFTGFNELTKMGGKAIDRGTTITGKRPKKQDKRRRKTTGTT